MKTDSAIAKLHDQEERHRLNAAIWVWSRDAGHFSDDERIRLIDVLEVCATDDESEGAALGLSTQNDSRAIDPLTAMLERGERDSAAKAAAKRAIASLKAAED